MSELFVPLLFLHVLGAIVALGPTFAFPLIGAMGKREPRYANFAVRVNHAIDDRIVIPVVLSTAVTGFGLIWVRSMPVFEPAYRWLLVAIVLYVVTLAYSLFVQRPVVLRVIAMTSEPVGTAIMATTGGQAVVGPPPALAAATAQLNIHGIVLTVLGLIQIFLMVVKPSLGL